MDKVDNARNFFSKFEKDENLDSLRKAIKIIEDILDGEVVNTNKESAVRVFKTNRKKFLDKRPETPGLLRPGMNGRP